MSSENTDIDYFVRRAREERERAAICEDNTVALAHLKMADEYDKRARTSRSSLQAVMP